MNNPQAAAARIHTYLRLLPAAQTLGGEIAYSEEFRSEDWPRACYAPTRDDVEALLAAVPAGLVAVPPTTTDRDRIAEIATPFFANFSDEEAAKVNAGELADALANLLPAGSEDTTTTRAAVLREMEQQLRPNTPPSRPEAPNPVKQRADCTEIEWAEQERARFERLYTRESVRADLAEAEAERLREQLEEAEDTAEQLVRNVQTVARDRESYRKAWKEEQQRRAKAEAEKKPADRGAVLNAAAQHLYTALFPAVYADMGQKAAEGVNRAVSELRRLADETQQQPETQAVDWATVVQPLTEADRGEEDGAREWADYMRGWNTCRTEMLAAPERRARCWHTEPGAPCDWNVCRQLERLAVGDRGTDPARTPAAASAGAEAVCKCPAEVCGCGHNAGVQTDEETSR